MNTLCIARTKCKSSGQRICTLSCPLFVDVRYQTELAGIPKIHQKYLASQLPETYYQRQAFADFASKIVERVESGKGLYLYSHLTGTGKSTTAVAMAQEYILERLKFDYQTGKRTPQLVKFINVADWLEGIRRGMNNDEEAQRSMETTESMKRVPLLVADDFGAEKISEWTRERLLTVISERYDNEKTVIFTSNISLQEVQVVLGSRLRSRIEGMTIPVEFKVNKDWRRKTP
ncbi:MAG: ATP-binding protein [Peptococcaceae bacterium]|nr:ATP-binding protein [Peptococcaceae bacterium]